MFGAVFDTNDDIFDGNNYNEVLNEQQRRPKNCASDLELPELPRFNTENNDFKQFVGIKNQGATCYLNSLIQSFYMSPEFKNAILSIPICIDSIENKSGLVTNEKKFNIILAFQKLFAEMDQLDIQSVNTEEITKSFGWGENQGLQQQDIQEALRVIFDVLERSLSETDIKSKFMQQYKGVIVNHVTCLKCENANEREEEFYDLILQVQNFNNIESSLKHFITPETLNGDNQYYCEKCGMKNDAFKGQKIRSFPDILTISLNRFIFDLETFQRKKVDSVLEYGLELNIYDYLENKNGIDKNNPECQYELQGVLIHRGNAHGGHYHAYIRDVQNQGNWQKLMNKYNEEQKLLEQQDKQKQQNNDIQSQKNDKIEIEENYQTSQNIQNTDKQDDNILNEQVNITKNIPQKTQNKNIKKTKKDKIGKIQNNNEKQKNSKQRKNEKYEKKKEDKKIKDANNIKFYDSKDFPIPYTNEELSNNWYDFNDSTVSAIPVNRLQSQFGGNSESAYILIYRKKTLNSEKFKNKQLPLYLQNYIDQKNQLLQQERQTYKIAEQHIELFFLDQSRINFETYKWQEDYNYEKDSLKINFDIKETLNQVIEKVKKQLQISENIQLIECFEKYNNKLLQFTKCFDNKQIKDYGQNTIEELEISHFSTWLILKDNEIDIFNKLQQIIGKEAVPIRLQIVVQGQKNQTIVSWSNMKLNEFRHQLATIFPEIQYEEQYIKEYKGDQQVNHLNNDQEKNNLTLNELKIYDSHDLILQKIDPILLEQIHLDQLNKQQQSIQKIEMEQLLSILVEKDDETDSHRIFIQLDWTLKDLLDCIKEKLNIEPDLKRRLRNLQINELYFQNDYSKKLIELEGFNEGGHRLQIERGDVPLSGNIIIKFINQSNQYCKDSQQVITTTDQLIQNDVKDKKQEIIIDEKQTISQLKQKICKQINLATLDHKLYKTDHLEEPYQVIQQNQENSLIKSLSIKSGDLLIVRHKSQLIQSELKILKLFFTKTGFSDDSQYISDITISLQNTVQDLKQKILDLPQLKQIIGTDKINISQLRIRFKRKDTFFGQILRKNDKIIKKFNFPTDQIVVQVLDKEEDLDENEICLILKQRDVKNRIYVDPQEFIFKAGQIPKIEDLYSQVIAHLKRKESTIDEQLQNLVLDDIKLVKYFAYDFVYTEISQETINNFQKSNKRKTKKQSKLENNIKKAPFLIKDDGDIIGYILQTDNKDNLDDFQTDQDAILLEQYQINKKNQQNYGKAQVKYRNGPEIGVQIQSLDEEEEIQQAIRQVEEFEKQQRQFENQNENTDIQMK